MLIARVVDAAFEEDAPCTDHFGIFGDEGALLSDRGTGDRQRDAEALPLRQIARMTGEVESRQQPFERGHRGARRERGVATELVAVSIGPQAVQEQLRTALASLFLGDGYITRWLQGPKARATISVVARENHYDLAHFDTIALAPFRELLGDEKFAAFRSYTDQQAERTQVNMLKASLASSGAPLSAEQAASLSGLMYEERKGFTFTRNPDAGAADPTAALNSQTVETNLREQEQLDERIANRAAVLLSPD